MKTNQNILICPLEWGLGHAARMIPVAHRLCELNNNVYFAAGKGHMEFLRAEMPSAKLISLPGFKPSYSRFLPQYLIILFQAPLLVWHIIREHSELKKIIREYKIDIVISDNRFGLWNRAVKSVYVTHMPRIPFPRFFSFLEFTGIALHRFFIRKYDRCFIPDLAGDLNLSGRLSHNLKLLPNTVYIGILSRFSLNDISQKSDTRLPANSYTVVLSGPEPQRGILRKKLSGFFLLKKLPAIFLGYDTEGFQKADIPEGQVYYKNLPASEMRNLLIGSNAIISRPGYTTLMELVSLGCTATVIPTPGQTEQEYLADYLSQKGWFRSIDQARIETIEVFPQAKGPDNSDMVSQSRYLLESALKDLLE